MMAKNNSYLPPESAPTGSIIPLEEILLILMLFFSILGVIITDFSPQEAYLYWLAMIPLFGVAAMIAGWAQARHQSHAEGYSFRILFRIQSLHWGGSFAAVIALFMLGERNFLSAEATGLVMLLILALTTFLDGIRIGWRFALAGIFLGVTTMVMAYTQQFLWIIMILAILTIFFTIYWEKRRIEKFLAREEKEL